MNDQKKVSEIQQQINAQLSEEPSDTDLIMLKGKLQRMQLIRILKTDETAAQKQAEQFWAEWQFALKGKKRTPDLNLTEAMLEETLGNAYFRTGDSAKAEQAWKSSAAKLKELNSNNLSFFAMQRLLALNLGQMDVAGEMESKLNKAGFHDPRMDPAYTQSEAFN